MISKYVVVLCTCPDSATAARLAQALVHERLAACVNHLPLRSVYRWQEAVHDEPEELLVIKTVGERFAELELRLAALHPYEVPEIIALPIAAGAAPYLAWLERECSGAHA